MVFFQISLMESEVQFEHSRPCKINVHEETATLTMDRESHKYTKLNV